MLHILHNSREKNNMLKFTNYGLERVKAPKTSSRSRQAFTHCMLMKWAWSWSWKEICVWAEEEQQLLCPSSLANFDDSSTATKKIKFTSLDNELSTRPTNRRLEFNLIKKIYPKTSWNKLGKFSTSLPFVRSDCARAEQSRVDSCVLN